MQAKNLPIGYYIKQADELLTAGVNQTMAGFNLTRLDWQILNLISEHQQISKGEISKLTEPLANSLLINDVIDLFQSKNYITVAPPPDDLISLTSHGRHLHTQCLEKQTGLRNDVMKGISESDYQTAVLTLQKIIKNVNHLL